MLLRTITAAVLYFYRLNKKVCNRIVEEIQERNHLKICLTI